MPSTPTMARNTLSGPTVFTDPVAGQSVEWAGAGDPMGGDLQPIPPALLENVQFQRAVTRGLIEIETDDAQVKQILNLHKQEWDERVQRQQSASQAAIDTAPDNDVLMLNCIGPSGRQRGAKCDQPVPVKSSKRNDAPPLCAIHKELAPNFIATEGEKIVEGKPEVNWVEARLGNRTRQD